MKPLNQLTQEHLPSEVGTSPSENTVLPELTPEETEAAISAEKNRRAMRLAIPPDKVRLSPEKIQRLIRFAREEKLSRLRTNAYWKHVDQPRSFISLSPQQMLLQFTTNASQIIRRPFIFDDQNTAIVQKLCYYFSASPEAEHHGLILTKGILLAGGVGTGKTTIMKAFASNPLQSFSVASSRRLSFDFSEQGFALIRHYSAPQSIPLNEYGQQNLGTCFDDLGTDEERKHYGDKLNALAEILLFRYENLPFNQTHLTTNLNADMISQIYGPRLRSRMREMFNLISFPATAPDRRI